MNNVYKLMLQACFVAISIIAALALALSDAGEFLAYLAN